MPLPSVIHLAMAQAPQSSPSSAVAELEISSGSPVHKTDSRGLGHKQDAHFWGFTAKIALPFPRRQQAGQIGPTGKQPSLQVLGCSAPAALALLLESLGQPGSPRGTTKARLTILSSLTGRANREQAADSVSDQMASQAESTLPGRGWGKEAGQV